MQVGGETEQAAPAKQAAKRSPQSAAGEAGAPATSFAAPDGARATVARAAAGGAGLPLDAVLARVVQRRDAAGAGDPAGPRTPLLQRAVQPEGAPGSRPVLTVGDTGPGVRKLQFMLSVKTDGRFGRITRRAVERFQAAAGMAAGPVDAATWDALEGSAGGPGTRPVLVRGDTGLGVRLLQRILGITDDGIFRWRTRRAVDAFQRAQGWVPRAVDGATWAQLEDDAAQQVADEMTAMADVTAPTRAVWSPSGNDPTSTNFSAWAMATTETPFTVNPATVINCWEMVLYASYRSGILPWWKIHDIYTYAGPNDWYVELARRLAPTAVVWDRVLHTPRPRRGDFVMFDGAGHVSLATGVVDGAGTHILSFWPPPDVSFLAGGTPDRVKDTTIEALAVVCDQINVASGDPPCVVTVGPGQMVSTGASASVFATLAWAPQGPLPRRREPLARSSIQRAGPALEHAAASSTRTLPDGAVCVLSAPDAVGGCVAVRADAGGVHAPLRLGPAVAQPGSRVIDVLGAADGSWTVLQLEPGPPDQVVVSRLDAAGTESWRRAATAGSGQALHQLLGERDGAVLAVAGSPRRLVAIDRAGAQGDVHDLTGASGDCFLNGCGRVGFAGFDPQTRARSSVTLDAESGSRSVVDLDPASPDALDLPLGMDARDRPYGYRSGALVRVDDDGRIDWELEVHNAVVDGSDVWVAQSAPDAAGLLALELGTPGQQAVTLDPEPGGERRPWRLAGRAQPDSFVLHERSRGVGVLATVSAGGELLDLTPATENVWLNSFDVQIPCGPSVTDAGQIDLATRGPDALHVIRIAPAS